MKTAHVAGLLFTLMIGVPAFATSGACSYHGGVDCDYETSDEHAVCMDGSASSVLYEDMQECQTFPVPIYSACTQDEYYVLQQECSQQAQIQNENCNGLARYGMSVSSCSKSEPAICAEARTCKAEADKDEKYQAEADRRESLIRQQALADAKHAAIEKERQDCEDTPIEKGSYAYKNGQCVLTCQPGYEDGGDACPIASSQVPIQPAPQAPIIVPQVQKEILVIPKKEGTEPIKKEVRTTEQATSSSTSSPVEPVGPLRHSFFYWLNPLHWFR